MTKPPRDSSVKRHELVYFGRITASVTHELNNVVAIINEYSGLVLDLCQQRPFDAAAAPPITKERLEITMNKISAQVARGREIIQRLNRFAHSVDEPLGEVDLNSTIADIIDHAERFASMKSVRLERRLSESSVEIQSKLFELSHLLFDCLVLAVETAREGEIVIVESRRKQDGVVICFRNHSAEGTERRQPDVSGLIDLTADLGGTIQTGSDLEGYAIELAIPNSIGKIEIDSPGV